MVQLPGREGNREQVSGWERQSTGSLPEPSCVGSYPWARPLPAPENLTLKSNFNNLINYIMCFIGWGE